MDITISLENLRNLLDQQKGKCWGKFDSDFRQSEFKKEIDELAGNEHVSNGFHEVRDKITSADYPDDFKVLQKYLMKDE